MKNWYRKQLLSYFPIFLLTITVIVLIGMVAVSDISRREAERANEIFAKYISEMIVGSLSAVEQAFLKEFTLNDGIMDFLDGHSRAQQEDIQLYEIASSLRTLQADYSLIQSIYLYRNKDGLVIMSDGKSTLEQFYDRDFLELAIKNSMPMGKQWSKVRMVPGFKENREVSVISLVKQLPIPFGQEGIAVINVKVNGFTNDIMMGKNSNLTYLDIIDQDEEVVLSSEKVIPSELERSNIVFLAQMPIETTNWTLRSGIKSGQFFQWFELISYTWIGAGAAVVVLSTIYVVYIFRRNYRPIAVILNKLKTIQLKTSLSQTEVDDVRFIEEALEDLTDQMKLYQQESQDNLLTRRRQLFIDLIEGSAGPVADMWQEHVPLLQQECGDAYKLLIVAEIEMDRLDLDTGDQSLIRLALQNMIQDFFSSELPAWCEWIYGNRLGVICLLGDAAYSESEIERLTKECHEWVKGHFDISFLFGAGVPFRSWPEVAYSYQGARGALGHRLTRAHDSVIFAAHIQPESNQRWMQVWPLMTDIAEMFQMRNDSWTDKMEKLFELFQTQQVKDQTIYAMIDSLLKLIQKKVGEGFAVLEISESWMTADISLKYDDLVVLEDDVQNILQTAYKQYLSIYEGGGVHTTLLEIREYILENYDHPDLSLKHLSDRFKLNGKNVSQMFKEAFGENFGDFVQQLRINKAKRLLIESDISQQEIANLVGYSNSITFGRMFKRVVGMTPGEYRKQNFNS
ncbi:helix-turn-helix domain-containing protein [Paenibacillus cisolokensis]|uniref:PDC sensor domain-containing protein n=1 Tax=Paenibacillus cisolokensis TaxID=1658519 RepID=UPI003D29F90C